MWFDKNPDIKDLFDGRFFGIITCDKNEYNCWKWFSQIKIDELVMYQKSCGEPFERLEKKLLYYDGSTKGLKPWGITTPWKLPSITGTDKKSKEKFQKYFLKCMKQIRFKYDEKQNKAKKNKVDDGGSKNKDGDSESGDNHSINRRKRNRDSAAFDDDDNKQNGNKKRRKLEYGGHISVCNPQIQKQKKVNKPKRAGNENTSREDSSIQSPFTSKSRRNKEVIKAKPDPKKAVDEDNPREDSPDAFTVPKERRGATVSEQHGYVKCYGTMMDRRTLRVNIDKYNPHKCQYDKVKHESHSIFESKSIRELNAKHRVMTHKAAGNTQTKNKKKETVCYLFHKSAILFLDHPTFYELFLFSCACTIQESDEYQADLDRMEEARYDSLMSQSEMIEKYSNWIVNDLSLNSKYLSIGPFALYELIMGDVNWILYEYKKYKIDSNGTIDRAAPEDPDFRHGSVVTLYKSHTTIPQKYLNEFLECMANYISREDTLEFFNDHVLNIVKGCRDQHGQKVYKTITKRIDTLRTETSGRNLIQTARFLWGVWFNEFHGQYAITRWTRQETNVNIPMVMTPLMRKIKKKMGPNFKWKNDAVGTVNFVSGSMLTIPYDDAFKSPMPDDLNFKFFETGGPERLIKKPDDSIKLIGCIKQNTCLPDDLPPNYNPEHYAFDFHLAHNGKNLFITCKAGSAVNKEVDEYTQHMLHHPNMFLYAERNNWNYYLGVDEYFKLSEQRKLMNKIKLCEKQMAKQQRDIDKFKPFIQEDEVSDDEDKKSKDKDGDEDSDTEDDDKNEKDKQEEKVSDEEDAENEDKDKVEDGDTEDGDKHGNDKQGEKVSDDEGDEKNKDKDGDGDTEDGDKNGSDKQEEKVSDEDEKTKDTDEDGDTEDDDKDKVEDGYKNEKEKQEHEVSGDTDTENEDKVEDGGVEDDESLSDTAV